MNKFRIQIGERVIEAEFDSPHNMLEAVRRVASFLWSVGPELGFDDASRAVEKLKAKEKQ